MTTMQRPDEWWQAFAERYRPLTQVLTDKRLTFPGLLPRIERIADCVQARSPRGDAAVSPIRVIDPVDLSRAGHSRHKALHELVGEQATRSWIYNEHARIELGLPALLETHRKLYAGQDRSAGRFKQCEIYLASHKLEGDKRSVEMLPTSSPDHVAGLMQAVQERFTELWDAERIDRLLLAGAYCVDVFGVHPFADGNGRTGRHMFVLMLLKAGHQAVPWLDLHSLFDARRLAYVNAAQRSMYKPDGTPHDPAPLVSYLLNLVASAYKKLEERVTRLEQKLL